MNTIDEKSFLGVKNAGFTLIELLVVVLIIGILAAVALPQYKKAVMKARFSNVLQVLHSLAKAEELYYMANNTYMADTDLLDYDYKDRCKSNDLLVCDQWFWLDVLEGVGAVSAPQSSHVRAYYCPGGLDWEACFMREKEFIYLYWLDHSAYPGKRECQGVTSLGKDFCKSLNL